MADMPQRRGADTGTLVRLTPEQLQILQAVTRPRGRVQMGQPTIRPAAPRGSVEMGVPTAYNVDVGAPQMPPQYGVQVGEPQIDPMQVAGVDLSQIYGAR